MRKSHLKKALVLAMALAIALAMLTLSACTPTKPSGSGGNKKTDKVDDVEVTKDGYTKGTASVDDVSKDLIKTIMNSAYTASKDRLTVANPLVSWWIDLDCDINGNRGVISFKVNYDVRDASSMTMRLSLLTEGSSKERFEMYFFAEDPTPDGERHPGALYLRFADNKMIIPMQDSPLSDIFPIETIQSEDLIAFIAGRLATINKISYEYKDEIGDKRTRRYALQVDVKKTIQNILDMLDNSRMRETYNNVKWIVENVFGVSVGSLSTDMPATYMSIKFVTEGGMRSAYGTGSLKEMEIKVDAEANGKEKSVFNGEKFSAKIELKKLSALRKLIDIPTRASLDENGYLPYDSRSVKVKTTLKFAEIYKSDYTMDISFLYNGLSDNGMGDKLMAIVSDEAGNDVISVYYTDNKLYINCLDAETNVEHNVVVPFDFDALIRKIELMMSGRDKMGFLKATTYVIGALQFSDKATKASYTFDKRFFVGVLNADEEGLFDILDYAYNAAGGTGYIRSKLEEAGIHIEKIIFNNSNTVTVDLASNDFISVNDQNFQMPSDPKDLSSLRKASR